MKESEIFDRSGGVPGGAPWERDWIEGEEQHLGRPQRPLRENLVRHQENLFGKGPGREGLTGRYKGTYYEKGVPRLPRSRVTRVNGQP